jgi:hypothetical protein
MCAKLICQHQHDILDNDIVIYIVPYVHLKCVRSAVPVLQAAPAAGKLDWYMSSINILGR